MDPVLDSDIDRRLDPALRPFATFRTDLSAPALAAVRASLNERRRETARTSDTQGVEIADRLVRGSVPVRIYRGAGAASPAVVYLHSGAFVLGNLDTDHRQCIELARRAECTVISVDYRLAPEHPFPAGFDDASTVLRWVAAESTGLGIDPTRIALAGSSAGAALAALLAQRCAAGAAPPVVFQLLHQPVLDNRPTPSKLEFATTPGFDGPATEQMWAHYGAGGLLPAVAVPARAQNLSGLPNTFISCSELDPLRDEAVDYAVRLMQAGIATELHVFPATCHGFDSLAPDWALSRELFAMQGAALGRALH